MPANSEDDNTVIAVEEITKSIHEKLNAEGIIKHKNIIQKLTCIITNKPPQRVTTHSPQRVTPTSTSVDITAPRIIKTSKRIHQRKTRSNTTMPTIIEDVELILEEFEDTVMSKEVEKEIKTIQKILPRKATPGPTLIPTARRNTSAKHASRKTIHRLVNEQSNRDAKLAQLKRTIQCQLDGDLKRRGVNHYHEPHLTIPPSSSKMTH